MITLIIHDTKNAATKDVAKKHKRRFFNMTQFLTGGGANRRNKLSKLRKNANKEGSREANIDNNNENQNKNKKNKGKNKEKSSPSNTVKGKEVHGKYAIPLRDQNSKNGKDNKKKQTLVVPEMKKEEISMTSSIVPLMNGNPISSFDTRESNPSSGSPNSNQGDDESPKVDVKEPVETSLSESNQQSKVYDTPQIESNQQKLCESPQMESNQPDLYESSQMESNQSKTNESSQIESSQPKISESPKDVEEQPSVIFESPKEISASELKKTLIDQKSDLFNSSNLTSSMTIKKFYQSNPSSVGKPLASIFENPESGQVYDENQDVHPPTSPSASASNPNINNPSLDVSKQRTKTTTFKTPTSAGSGSNSEAENESTIFDYNAYKRNANNKNYIVNMLKQHYQTCLDEIDYVRKREKTLNSLKSGFEKGLCGGGLYGFLKGWTKPQPVLNYKLRLNRALNLSTKYGPWAGNSMGVLGLMYTSFDTMLKNIRKDEPNDYYNHVGAGFLSGALYKSTAGLKVATLSGGIFAGMVALCGLGTKAIKDTKEKIKEKKGKY
ncbi:hypothetical protein PIROE2DRAFT_61820 [Piromyces sp. E2]|nr:hypothetical protein PIROE2DRAFT_61820 [Piromyces sp. E2]|eukprot:OUM62558.1 hypothetical protein PIROE2DRAFT_61820 [Piromyces sp. E2]